MKTCDHKFVDSDRCLKCGTRAAALKAEHRAELNGYYEADREHILTSRPQGAD